MTGVVDRLSRVRDILEDAEIDQIPEEDWPIAMNRAQIIHALRDGGLNILTLVDAFIEINKTIYEINKAVNE